MKRALLATVAALSTAAPAAAGATGVSLEATIGSQRLGMTRAPGANEPLLAMGDYGAALLVRGGPLEVGFAAEGTFERGDLARYNASALAGLGADVAMLRLEVLGELGVVNLRTRSDLDAAAAGDDRYVRFYGVRPGLSARLPLVPFRLGLWGLARWGLPGTSGPAYGMLARVGVDF